MKNPFLSLFHARDKPGRQPLPQNAVSAAPTFYFGTSNAGKSVNPKNAIQVSAVYACVRVIAETIASLPFAVYESTNTGSMKATKHPLYRLLHDEPNSEMTSFVWRETMLSHLLLYGNSYCQIIRSERTNIVGLYPLLPDRMDVDHALKLLALQRACAGNALVRTNSLRTNPQCLKKWHELLKVHAVILYKLFFHLHLP